MNIPLTKYPSESIGNAKKFEFIAATRKIPNK
jgi:hypothetical protein